MPVTEFLTDLLDPDLAFLRRAVAVTVIAAVLCGVVGCHVVLRGMAFIGDAVAHAVFPGLAVAFLLQGSLVLGGMVAGTVTAVLVAVFAQNRRVKEDSVIGVFLVASFALGLIVISRAPGYAGSLQRFLFGSITGVASRDLVTTAGAAFVVLAAVALLHQQLVAVSLDREMARAMGLRVFRLDVVLYVCVTLAVVVALQTVGNILVLALLIAPAATARLLTDRLPVMMTVAPAVGALGATVGIYFSWSHDLPVGATIVVVLAALFVACWALAPRHGMIARRIRSRSGGATAVVLRR
jgi:manganese/iron transport system permease protein